MHYRKVSQGGQLSHQPPKAPPCLSSIYKANQSCGEISIILHYSPPFLFICIPPSIAALWSFPTIPTANIKGPYKVLLDFTKAVSVAFPRPTRHFLSQLNIRKSRLYLHFTLLKPKTRGRFIWTQPTSIILCQYLCWTRLDFFMCTAQQQTTHVLCFVGNI